MRTISSSHEILQREMKITAMQKQDYKQNIQISLSTYSFHDDWISRFWFLYRVTNYTFGSSKRRSKSAARLPLEKPKACQNV